MDAQRFDDVAGLLKGPLSNPVRAVLRDMGRSRMFDPPTGDISTYLGATLRQGAAEPDTTNGRLFQLLSAITPADALEALMGSHERVRSLALSPGLAAAFADAFEIRRQTGGKDAYIGARHVLLAVTTSRDEAVRGELNMAAEMLGLREIEPLVAGLADIVTRYPEDDERLEVWAELLLDRGFSQIAETIKARAGSGATASQPPESTEGPPPEAGAARMDGAFQRQAIAGIRNDDPSALKVAEIVGVDGAATALARVIAAKAFEPPLAVGVFGPWGSGKSFLLRRISKELERLRTLRDPAFHSEIVEVRFNAWHYVDTDLWANLVGQIFETLDRRSSPDAKSNSGVLNRLTTARDLTLKSARDLAAKRKATQEAQEDLRRAEEALERRRSAVATRITAVLQGAVGGLEKLDDKDAKALVEKTYGKPLRDMAVQWGTPEAALELLRRDGAVWLQIRRDLGGAVPIASCLVITVAVASLPFWLPQLLERLPVAELIRQVSPVALAASGLLTSAAAWMAGLTRKAVVARDSVVAAVSGYRKAAAKAATHEADDLKRVKEAADTAALDVDAAQRALDSALGSQALAATAFASETPAERLKSFIKVKVALDGPYRSREGLISTIRRDFSDLTALMSEGATPDDPARAAHEKRFRDEVEKLKTDYPDFLTDGELNTLAGPPAEAATPERFDRIILYIDDLDRCPADKVLDVLQAVHLLMAFSLFVVVVAVDVRWLEGALEDRYRQFDEVADAPEALEYLEKVFQLAIWTQPLPAVDVGGFIRGRLSNVYPATTAEAASSGAAAAGAARDGPDADDDRPEAAVDAASLEPANAEALRVTREEVRFLEIVCAPLDMTPRRLLRLINSYQVARASLSRAASEALVQQGHRGFIALLALAVAWPECLTQMNDALRGSEDWAAFAQALTRGGSPSLALQVEPWRQVLESEGVRPEDLRPYVELTMRFSFVGRSRRRSGS